MVHMGIEGAIDPGDDLLTKITADNKEVHMAVEDAIYPGDYILTINNSR